MILPEIPVNEIERIEELVRYGILDSPPEKEFDDITWLASKIADTPIALVSLVDSGRQWFKSRMGLDVPETSRDFSFCAHAINETRPLLVENALEDVRFRNNPFVIDGLNIRFYCGIPLTSPKGFNLGTLCVIDQEPRSLNEEQQKMLSVLARQVVSQMELRRTGLELRAAAEKADAANQAKSHFLANMSHEIRTPMNAIVGLTDLVLEKGIAGEQQDYLLTIKDSSETLMYLIDDILDFSKIEAGKLDLESTPFDVWDRVEKFLAAVREKALEKGLSFDLEIDPATPRYVRGDPYRLGQIMINLTGNAVKFTSEGSIFVKLNAVTNENGLKGVGCRVTDTGIGIATNKLSRIFEAFAQEDGSTTRLFGGTGLGLAISQRLVKMLGGEISLRSEKEKGTEFFFTAFFDQAEEGDMERVSPGGAMVSRAELTGLRALVVEDNVVNQKLAARFLERMGIKVALAGDGKTALAMLGENQYDLVLMDVQMPGMDGLEATGHLREMEEGTGRYVPVVAMTAHAMKGDRERCLAAGMTDYIPKPMKRDHFEDVVKRALAMSGTKEDS